MLKERWGEEWKNVYFCKGTAGGSLEGVEMHKGFDVLAHWLFCVRNHA